MENLSHFGFCRREPIYLDSSIDLNNVTSLHGITEYYVEIGLPKNAPTEITRGALMTYSIGAHGFQIIFDFSREATHIRYLMSDRGGFTKWYKVLTSD